MRIIVTGLIAQHPTLGGVTWDYLQYVCGLRCLGHDVYYFEDSGEWPYTLDGGPTGDQWIAHDPTSNIEYLEKVMRRFDMDDRWAYRFPTKPRWFGLSDKKRREVLKTAELLINVSGTLESLADYHQIPRRAYIDTDPVFTQVKLNLNCGQSDFQKRVAAHNSFFSFGENLSQFVPSTEYSWIPTRTPIVLSQWQPLQPTRNVFSTVMSWTSYQPLRFSGKTYAQKDVEFARFLGLPEKIKPTILEVALSQTQHPEWQTKLSNLPFSVEENIRKNKLQPDDVLKNMGWKIVNPALVCSDLDSYRSYVESSKGEWSVAKNGYVVGQSGWFSCRSACYLAAGRPVVVQETGFSKVLPTGEGIISFKTMDEAVEGIRDIEKNYDRHCKAAREIAEKYFDSDQVLSKLIDDITGSPSKKAQLKGN